MATGGLSPSPGQQPPSQRRDSPPELAADESSFDDESFEVGEYFNFTDDAGSVASGSSALLSKKKRRRVIDDGDEDSDTPCAEQEAVAEETAEPTVAQDRPLWSAVFQDAASVQEEQRRIALEQALEASVLPLPSHAEPKSAKKTPRRLDKEHTLDDSKEQNADSSSSRHTPHRPNHGSPGTASSTTLISSGPMDSHVDGKRRFDHSRLQSAGTQPQHKRRSVTSELAQLKREREAMRNAATAGVEQIYACGASMEERMQALIRYKGWSMTTELPPQVPVRLGASGKPDQAATTKQPTPRPTSHGGALKTAALSGAGVPASSSSRGRRAVEAVAKQQQVTDKHHKTDAQKPKATHYASAHPTHVYKTPSTRITVVTPNAPGRGHLMSPSS